MSGGPRRLRFATSSVTASSFGFGDRRPRRRYRPAPYDARRMENGLEKHRSPLIFASALPIDAPYRSGPHSAWIKVTVANRKLRAAAAEAAGHEADHTGPRGAA
jgi:hypothetical protein